MNTKRKTRTGCTPGIRGYFSALPAGTELPETQVVMDFADRYNEKQVRGSLSYLTIKSGDLERHMSNEGCSYVFKGEVSTAAETKPEGYVGLLLDTEEVILQVGKTTMRMSPTEFRALRQKLRSLD